MGKVLLLNGSPHPHGCTAAALEEMIRVFEQEGMETECIHVGNKDIRGCISCGRCVSVCPTAAISFRKLGAGEKNQGTEGNGGGGR